MGWKKKGRNEERGGETQVGRAGEVRGATKLSKADQGQKSSGKVRGCQGRSGDVM